MENKVEDKARYYFNQFWSFYNPEMLRSNLLTEVLEKLYQQEWDYAQGIVEIVNKNYIDRLKRGRINEKMQCSQQLFVLWGGA